MLMDEFKDLGIKYEQITWDNENSSEGKSIKRSVGLNDIKELEPFHWGYEFSEIFRKKDGFDAIITNPPWEIFKPNSKEFFLDYSKTVSRKKMSIKDFEKEQEIVLKDKEIRKEWIDYLSRFPHVSSYYRSATQFKNQISIVNGKKAGTDINLYKLFTEQCFNLIKKGGYCGIVIPSGIYTDLGTKQLRQMLFEQSKMTGLFCFENKKEIFENVHRSFKFVVLTFEKEGSTKSFPAAFMRHDVKELDYFPKHGAFVITMEFIKKQSPDSLSVTEIKNETEFNIAEKMMSFPFLREKINDTWNISLSNEFHMTNDSHLFKTSKTKNSLPLYEGKMIWQFDAYYAEPKYWIEEKIGRQAILGRKIDDHTLLDYQKYRMAFREIASSTNERGLIATILPKNVFANHKLMISNSNSEGLDDIHKILLSGFLNSFVFDFQVRQKTSTSISMHIFYQLTIPRLNVTNKWFKPIVERAAKLICTTEEFAELWKDVMKTEWNEKAIVKTETERNKLKAELDGIIAHIYGLTEEEFTYILTTFPIVAQAQKDAALLSFKKLAPQFKDVDKSEEQLIALIQKGETNKVEFKSTLRVDVKTGKPEKFIEHSVLKTLAAFLNSDGGRLLIGVDDDKNILGLEGDFNSFSKPDKLDEFQKHFDNLISKSLGNRFHRYMQVEFPKQDDKIVCIVTIKEKSSEPVYIINEAGQESFYIRRQASTIELKLSEALIYIKEHWR